MHSPSLEEFQKLAARGNLIPVTRNILADFETPLSAYLKIRGEGESFLFESVEGGERIGRYSFVGCNPRAVIKQTGDVVEVIEGGKVAETFTVGKDVKDGLEIVERVMKKYRAVALPTFPVSPVARSVLSVMNSFMTLNRWYRGQPWMNYRRRSSIS